MREAAILLFNAFPDSFLLCGGANLILFHNSVRYSVDLDLLLRSGKLLQAEPVIHVLSEGLQNLAGLLRLSPLEITVLDSEPDLLRVEVAGKEGARLFTVDFTRIGSVLESGIEVRPLEAVSLETVAAVSSLSRNHLLLQKAETFMLRKFIKARDAYDIKLLLDGGATLDDELREHLDATLSWEQLDAEDIKTRVTRLDEKLCRAELENYLPGEIYKPLVEANFQSLRDAVLKVFENWR